MFESIYTCTLIILEMTFIFVALAMMFHQRETIGKAPFYISFGFLLLFHNFLYASEITVDILNGIDFPIATITCYLPLLACFLLIYITNGVLAAQRLIIGSATAFGLFLYLGTITSMQSNWLGFSITSGLSASTFEHLINNTNIGSRYNLFIQLLDFFLVPIIYTKLIAANWRRLYAIGGAFLTSQIICKLPNVIMNLALGGIVEPAEGVFFARFIATIWLSLLLELYLTFMEKDLKTKETSPLELVFAFFGSYSRSKELESNLKESELRYKSILENASELIILLNNQGIIIDANKSTCSIFNIDINNLLNQPINNFIDSNELIDFSNNENFDNLQKIKFSPKNDNTDRIILGSLSKIILKGQTVWFLIGRDITDEVKLEQEKEELSEQLIHSQRMQALGILAGGIAHDFNNCIHGILGHIDLASMYLPEEDKKVRKHLDKVIAVADKAGKLTTQLLGFARKGKYNITRLPVDELFDSCLTMLSPDTMKNVKITTSFEPTQILAGDVVQLNQALLNLLLNAKDALRESKKENLTIHLSVEDVKESYPNEKVPPHLEKQELDYYLCLSVADNGCGMSEETIAKVFEPFFTTKPVGLGTGMGLAMVYGTINNHKGWIRVESTVGVGTTFKLFLPKYIDAE